MKIVYHCYGGAHASPTAAAIHLGLLPSNRFPHFYDFKKIPFFDCTVWNEHGKLIKVGVDSDGNEVYIMGRRSSAKMIINLIKELVRLNGGDPEEYYFVNCLQMFNLFMVTGGYSSRAMGWVKFGRPVVTFGTMISFPVLVSIVQKTARHLGIHLQPDYRET